MHNCFHMDDKKGLKYHSWIIIKQLGNRRALTQHRYSHVTHISLPPEIDSFLTHCVNVNLRLLLWLSSSFLFPFLLFMLIQRL